MAIDDDYAHGKPCVKCGGTGEAFDHDANDWLFPPEDCAACKGTGDEGVRRIHAALGEQS